jgi:pimeloyl-ACP methyl ester carboxylesterase
MGKVYFISGLGADKRVFSFLDLSFCDPVYIEWIRPLPHESLQQYALRLREQIPDPRPVIVGISLGGMLVTEMARADKNIKGIIISSNKIAAEFPRYLRIGNYLPVYKWMPAALSKRMMLMTKNILGAKGKEQKEVLKQIIRDTDISFAKWAINAILHWKNNDIPSNLVHIHGTADKLLPCRLVKADHIIEGGTHVMTMDHHREITDILKKLIL